MMRFQSVIKNSVIWLIFFIFILAVEYYWGWATVLAPWQALSPIAIFVSIILFLLSYQIRTWRLYDYFLPQTKGRWIAALRLMLLHNILNNLLPARSGEISFPLLMKRYFAVDYLQSIPALLWFRLLDLHTLLSLGFVTWAISLVLQHRLIYLPIVILWLLLPLVFYTLKNTLRSSVSHSWVLKVLEGLPQNAAMFWRNWFLTWLNWVIKLAILVWLLGQFLQVDITYLVSSVIAGELSSVLPFHAPGGVGTYEAGMVVPLLAITDTAQAAKAAINVHLFMLFSSMIGGLIGWLLPVSTNKTC
jgi:uncharacterized membrane protein YbhN (UPF0104 family)